MRITSSEMAQRDAWVGQRLLAGEGALFSFVYAGRNSAELLPGWERKTVETRLDADRTQHVLTWTDAGTGLCVRCVAVVYGDYPAVEWTVYLRNNGTTSTPIRRDIQGLDVSFQREPAGEFVLHGNKGDRCVTESFEPYRLVLGAGIVRRFAPMGGRPTNGPGGWPYYNLQMPGSGVMLAIGWPGQWAASFQRDMDRGLRVLAGQERTCLALEPGEEIRTPLNVLFFWEGDDPVRAQNLWRRWFMAHKKWVARQFDLPEEGHGFVQAIRLPQAAGEKLVVHPKALRPERTCVFENPESAEVRESSGAALASDGFAFALPKREGAIWFYRLVEEVLRSGERGIERSESDAGLREGDDEPIPAPARIEEGIDS
ncbi:MAG: hypothetical protein N3A38_00945 [Planctomycetota bacterium]|nr:hypothetical protein [Planctomycetota bacterium]